MFRRALCVFGCCAVVAILGAVSGSPETAAAAKHPYNRGCELMGSGRYPDAIKAFQKALRLNSKDTDALNNLAVCYIELKRYAKALPLLRKVLALNPRYKGANLNVGADYAFQEQLSRAVPPTREAQSAAGSALARRVKGDAYYNLGRIYALQGKFLKAAEAFRQSQGVWASREAMIDLGASLCAAGQYDQGLAALAWSLQGGVVQAATVNIAVARYHRGLEELAAGDTRAARQDIKASLSMVRSPAALIAMGMVEAESGDLPAALKSFTSVRDSNVPKAVKGVAQQNIDHALDLLDQQSRTLKLLVLILGSVLLVLYLVALVRAIRKARYRGRGGKWKVALGIIIGLGVVTALTWQYLNPQRSAVLAGVALGAGLVAVLLMWSGRTSWSG